MRPVDEGQRDGRADRAHGRYAPADSPYLRRGRNGVAVPQDGKAYEAECYALGYTFGWDESDRAIAARMAVTA